MRLISSKTKALKNKVVDKVSNVLSAPTRSYHDSKRRSADRDYNSILSHRAMRKSGVVDKKQEAVYQSIKSKYGSQ